jgi:hypothetical protein
LNGKGIFITLTFQGALETLAVGDRAMVRAAASCR